MLSVLFLTAALAVGQPAPAPKSGKLETKTKPAASRLDNRATGPKTTVYMYTTPPSKCWRSMTNVRVDGPMNNPNGVVYRRVSGWHELTAAEAKRLVDYEMWAFTGRR